MGAHGKKYDWMVAVKTNRVVIYSQRPCSSLALGMIIEPFSHSNRLNEQCQFEVIHHQQNDAVTLESVVGESGFDWIILLAESAPNTELFRPDLTFIKHQLKYTNAKVLALDCGVYWLAAIGLMSDRPVAVHWHYSEDFQQSFPQQPISTQLFHDGPNCITCVGKLATLDAVLCLISRYQSAEIIRDICDYLCIDRIRSQEEKQRLPSSLIGGVNQPRLTMALELMEQNIEEPLSTDDIADLVHISRRQLERLFKQYLNTMPAKHYLGLRLERAKKLLLTTNTSIVQIGLSCGFSSGPHFSSSYKAFYQITPREERSRKLNR